MQAGYAVLRFEDILAGAAGAVETEAALKWLNTGAPVQALPAGLAVRDETGFDTRVIDKDVKKRGRRLSSETVVPQQSKQLRRTATGTKGEAAKPGRPKRKQQPKKPAAGAASSAWEAPNLYSRAAFVTHGDGSLGLLARRRARGARPPRSGAGDLPAGWRMVVKTIHRGPQAGSKYKVYLHEASGRSFPTLAQAKVHWEGLGPPAAEAAAALAASPAGDQQASQEGLPPGWQLVWAALEEGMEAGQQGQAFYISPEGMVFEEWEEVEQWLELDASSGCPTPSELLSTLRQAAVAQHHALPAGPAGALTLLGLQRARVALFKEERQRLARTSRATAAAAAAAIGAPGRPGRQPSAGSKLRGSAGTGSQGRAAAAAGAGGRAGRRGRQQQEPTAASAAVDMDVELAGAASAGEFPAGSGPAVDSTGARGLPAAGQESVPADVAQATADTRPESLQQQQQLGAATAREHYGAGQEQPALDRVKPPAPVQTLAEPEVIDLT